MSTVSRRKVEEGIKTNAEADSVVLLKFKDNTTVRLSEKVFERISETFSRLKNLYSSKGQTRIFTKLDRTSFKIIQGIYQREIGKSISIFSEIDEEQRASSKTFEALKAVNTTVFRSSKVQKLFTPSASHLMPKSLSEIDSILEGYSGNFENAPDFIKHLMVMAKLKNVFESKDKAEEAYEYLRIVLIDINETKNQLAQIKTKLGRKEIKGLGKKYLNKQCDNLNRSLEKKKKNIENFYKLFNPSKLFEYLQERFEPDFDTFFNQQINSSIQNYKANIDQCREQFPRVFSENCLDVLYGTYQGFYLLEYGFVFNKTIGDFVHAVKGKEGFFKSLDCQIQARPSKKVDFRQKLELFCEMSHKRLFTQAKVLRDSVKYELSEKEFKLNINSTNSLNFYEQTLIKLYMFNELGIPEDALRNLSNFSFSRQGSKLFFYTTYHPQITLKQVEYNFEFTVFDENPFLKTATGIEFTEVIQRLESSETLIDLQQVLEQLGVKP